MLRSLRSLAVLLSVGLAVPAAAQTVRAQDPASVVAAMESAGLPVTLSKDDNGDPLISSSLDGDDFLVYFYNCTDNTDCRSVQFYLGWEVGEVSLEKLNAWNRDWRFGRAYLSENGLACLAMDVDLEAGGMSTALLVDNLEFWEEVVAEFGTHLDTFAFDAEG